MLTLTQLSANMAAVSSATVEDLTEPANAPDGAEFGTRQILAIDDESDALECLRRFFEIEGFQVATASSADEALLRIHEKPPDLIITDHQMPGMSGMELCKHLRSHPQIFDIPIILYSAMPLSDSDTRMFDQAITKPADLKALVAAARKLLLLDTGISKPPLLSTATPVD
jgi:CheY-like chemotaxis protein